MLKYNTLIIGLISIIILTFSSCQKESGDFSVKGKLSNISDSYFYISYEKENKPVIDTISINKNGEFSFDGYVDTLTVMSMYFNSNKRYTYILVDKGWNIEIRQVN